MTVECERFIYLFICLFKYSEARNLNMPLNLAKLMFELKSLNSMICQKISEGQVQYTVWHVCIMIK